MSHLRAGTPQAVVQQPRYSWMTVAREQFHFAAEAGVRGEHRYLERHRFGAGLVRAPRFVHRSVASPSSLTLHAPRAHEVPGRSESGVFVSVIAALGVRRAAHPAHAHPTQ